MRILILLILCSLSGCAVVQRHPAMATVVGVLILAATADVHDYRHHHYYHRRPLDCRQDPRICE